MKMKGIANKTNARFPRDNAWNHKEDCRLEESPRQHAMALAKSKARFHMLYGLAPEIMRVVAPLELPPHLAL